MRVLSIAVASLFVDHQEKVLKFYTEVLGFTKKRTSRWARPGR